MPFCAFCDAELPADLRVGREARCPSCDGFLHVCVQCRFYEPTLHNQCLEPEAEHVRDRQKPNFCEFFQLPGSTRGAPRPEPGRNDVAARGRPAGGKTVPDPRAAEARARLEALFKKKPPAEDDD
jgi:hypothetical protein